MVFCVALYVRVAIIEGFKLHRILFGCPDACIRCATCIAGKPRRPAGPILEAFDNSRVAKQRTQTSELIVDQRIHRIENQSSHGWSLAKRDWSGFRFAGKLPKDW